MSNKTKPPIFSVCTDAVFPKLKTEDAIAHVKELGFDTIEFWPWWEKDMRAVAASGRCHDVTIAAFCTRFVSLVDPSQRRTYLDGLAESIDVAKMCGTKILISQVGNDTGAEFEAQRDSLVAGLRASAPMLEDADITLAIEPLNTRIDHKGYFLAESRIAYDIIDAVDSQNVKILYDIYHQHVTGENRANTLYNRLDKIAHLHIAGAPGRHEPFDSKIEISEIFAELKRAGYSGYLGLEYFPVNAPENGLTRILEIR